MLEMSRQQKQPNHKILAIEDDPEVLALYKSYLQKRGYTNMFTPVASLHWMGAWPQDDAQCAALVAYGGTLAAIGGAVSVTTKSTHEAFGLPPPQATAEGLRTTRMASDRARTTRLAAARALDNGSCHRTFADVFDRSEAVANGHPVLVRLRREFEAAVIHVRRENRNPHPLALPDEDGHFVRVVDLVAEQTGH